MKESKALTSLGDDEAQFQSMVHDFAIEKVRPRVEAMDRTLLRVRDHILDVIASVGHASAQAVCLPASTRAEHMMHFCTRGRTFDHSYFGTPYGHATMQ